MISVNNKWKKYKVKENRKGTRYRNGDTLKPRMKNWTKMACRTKWRVFFSQDLAYSKDLPSIRRKNVEVYFVKELWNRSLSPPPSPYRQQDSDKWHRTRSDLGTDFMDKLNNLGARENHHCSQYHILVHLDEMHSEICLYGRCSYCPMKEAGTKSLF